MGGRRHRSELTWIGYWLATRMMARRRNAVPCPADGINLSGMSTSGTQPPEIRAETNVNDGVTSKHVVQATSTNGRLTVRCGSPSVAAAGQRSRRPLG